MLSWLAESWTVSYIGQFGIIVQYAQVATAFCWLNNNLCLTFVKITCFESCNIPFMFFSQWLTTFVDQILAVSNVKTAWFFFCKSLNKNFTIYYVAFRAASFPAVVEFNANECRGNTTNIVQNSQSLLSWFWKIIIFQKRYEHWQ